MVICTDGQNKVSVSKHASLGASKSTIRLHKEETIIEESNYHGYKVLVSVHRMPGRPTITSHKVNKDYQNQPYVCRYMFDGLF